MAIDLTPAVKAEMMVSRLELPDGIYPVLGYNDEDAGWVELATLDPNDGYAWDLTKASGAGAVPKDYLRLRIIDQEDFKSIIDQTEAVEYDGNRYKVSRVARPFGVPRVWQLRLDFTEDHS